MVELVLNFSQAERYKNSLVRGNTRINTDSMRFIARIKGCSIYLEKHDHKDWVYNSRFYAVNDTTGLVEITVDGDMQPSGKSMMTFTVNTLDGRKGRMISAHEFYRSIMLNMSLIMVTETQSYGGMRTWQELARYPDIEIFGWLHGKPINIDPFDPEETHATERETVTKYGKDRDMERVMQMKLISHRKGKRHEG